MSAQRRDFEQRHAIFGQAMCRQRITFQGTSSRIGTKHSATADGVDSRLQSPPQTAPTFYISLEHCKIVTFVWLRALCPLQMPPRYNRVIARKTTRLFAAWCSCTDCPALNAISIVIIFDEKRRCRNNFFHYAIVNRSAHHSSSFNADSWVPCSCCRIPDIESFHILFNILEIRRDCSLLSALA